ncbi:MAG: serine/threonine-protein kinase [Ardenticatenaceae bacterium]
MSSKKQIGRYQIIKELARDAMSVVFQAYDPDFERKVAVKVLLKHFINDERFHKRFKAEAGIIAALKHPAIVPVYDLGREWNRPFVAMRYMRGGSLADRLRNGRRPLHEVGDILSRLADGLDKVHEKGILHRNIKPENVLFDEHDKAYLADFGMTRLIDGRRPIGTPQYMAPEQLTGQDLDPRTDVYQLGVMLFKMLTGDLPSVGQIPSVRAYNPDLPSGCDQVMAHALATKKENRFSSAGELAAAFAAVIVDRPAEPVHDHSPIETNQNSESTAQKPVPPIVWGILSLVTLTLLAISNWATLFPPS